MRPHGTENATLPKIRIFMTLTGSYTGLAMGICAASVSQMLGSFQVDQTSVMW